MKRILFALSAITLLPVLAAAQTDDAAYCAQLSGLAQRYIGGNGGEGRSTPDLATSVAIEECRKGNTASGIPYLEKRLREVRITLPKRS